MHQEDSGTNHRPGTERDLSWRDLVGVLRGAEMDSLQLNQEDVELSQAMAESLKLNQEDVELNQAHHK